MTSLSKSLSSAPMKLPEKLRFKNLVNRDKKGVALITVLTVMALTTILVLTFFSLATSEQRASNTYSHGLHAHQVAETAVNLVIAQIREGTYTEVPGTSLSQRKAWACQPGAIRRWDNKGVLDNVFKLYSDEEMVADDVKSLQDDYSDLRGWSKKPAHYVDLNEPVIRGEKVYYPVVHPAATVVPNWPKKIPGEEDDNGVEGFSFSVLDVESGEFGEKATKVVEQANGVKLEGHLALPVQWLYQLADGTVGVLNSSGSDSSGYEFKAISGSGKPSEKNQMVARFAFWADDESQKLNLNTHAGGLAWDIPKAGGELDMDMGRHQPAQKEWQRYPGHPATTHLGTALSPGIIDIVYDRDAMEMLYDVVPRVVGGGSESGTRLIDTRDPKEQNGLVPDTEPLFPSIDDMIMRSDREQHEYPDANGSAIPAQELSEYLERSKFFITVNSRAPEVNMFNLPRVAIWPIFNADRATGNQSEYMKKLSPFDRLIHYCASVGGTSAEDRYDYIFRREKADSTTFDYDGIPRNQEVYAYLDQLMSNDVPGYGGKFSSPTKYGPEGQKQLLTQIFDYVRSTNLHDDTLYEEDFEAAFTKKNRSNHLTYTNPRNGNEFNKGFGHKGHGQVTPIRIGETKGMGRFFTISNAEILVACVAEPGASGSRFAGVNGYQGNGQQGPEGTAFSNLPPLPQNFRKETKETWPTWLRQIEDGTMPSLPGELEAALEEENWNWNLAFLDPQYLSAVMSNPTANKFNRANLGAASMGTVTRLKQGEKMVQAGFMFSLFSPSIGWSGINPDMQIDIKKLSGMNFAAGAGNPTGSTIEFLGFTGQGDRPSGVPADTFRWSTNWVKPHREGGARAWGGLLPFSWVASARDALGDRAFGNKGSVWWHLARDGATTSGAIRSRLTPLDRGYDAISSALGKVDGARDIGGDPGDIAQAYRYDLVTVPFKVDGSIQFNGGEVSFEISDGGENSEESMQDDDESSLVQTIDMEFPSFSYGIDQVRVAPGRKGWVNEFNALGHDSTGFLHWASVTADGANPWSSKNYSAGMKGGTWTQGMGANNQVTAKRRNFRARGRLALAASHWDGRYLTGYDIVQSVAVSHGDMRLVAADPEVKKGEYFAPHRNYGKQPMAHSLTNSLGASLPGFNSSDNSDYLIVHDLKPGLPYRNRAPLPFATDKSRDVQLYGDFDNGAGTMIDGPYINKPDEGNVHALKTRMTQEIVHYWEAQRNYGEFPYFSNPEKAEAGGPAYFSPNRIVSGPGMFGSLPTGLGQDKPWQTLLFRPDSYGAGGAYRDSHPGALSPPDHLVMDLFWMPVVEPYAISEPLSTSGKINLNFEMMPFMHVERTTALRGVFKSEFMVCIPNKYHMSYKHGRGRGRFYHWRDNPFGGELQGKRLRSVIQETATLDQFKERFNKGEEIFKSATEVCEIHLVPQEISDRFNTPKGSIGHDTPTVEQMQSSEYWKDYKLVGDNSRERPYTNIQQRTTTKSNTFKVHYRAQVLKQSRRDSPSEYSTWKPELDTVQAEYRGSSIVERYVDPNDDRIPDFATDITASLSEYYQFRVVNPKRFAP